MPEVEFLFTILRLGVRFCLFEIRVMYDSIWWPDKANPRLLPFGTNLLGYDAGRITPETTAPQANEKRNKPGTVRDST